MKRNLFKWVSAALLGIALVAGGNQSAKADDGWNDDWSWRDSAYRPYYLARPSYTPYYGGATYYSGYRAPYYRSYYNPAPSAYYPRTYYSAPYGRYYGAPNAGYYENPYGGGQVQVGRLRIGWR